MEELLNIIRKRYLVSDYPSLLHQTECWSKTQPLKGVKIIDATPIYTNTLVKHIALLASGAELMLGLSNKISSDKKVVEMMRRLGIKTVECTEVASDVDIIMDCGAVFNKFNPTIGFVELTRSGIYGFENCKKPVFMADSGKIKYIETLLGTGDSYFRAMSHFGYNDWMGKKLTVFGSGKVGCGIISKGASLCANITVVTDPQSLPDYFKSKVNKVIDYRNTNSVIAAIEESYAVVTATGHASAIKNQAVLDALLCSKAILANMGAEDEYGDNMPATRVLASKSPINFSLEEPTHLRFIEATMALDNIGATYLMTHPNEKGIINPPIDIENEIIDIVRRQGEIDLDYLNHI